MEALDDLNIVAIDPEPKIQPVHRKRNNKYERRRQRAQKARNQKHKQRLNSSLEEVYHRNNDDIVGGSSSLLSKTNGSSTTEKQKLTVEILQNQRKQHREGPADKITVGNSVESSKVTRNLDEEFSIIPVEKSSSKSDDKRKDGSPVVKPLRRKEGKETESKHEHKERKLGPVILTKPSRRHHHSEEGEMKHDDSNDSNDEHAKYMAEFHARPMELDRRSGARRTTKVSTESQHLFEVAQDWSSLKVHPRLLQSLKKAYDKPTTIQAKAIQAFSSSSENNVLIHSETGSGKTLAYLLPILQCLAFQRASDDDDMTKMIMKRKPRKELGTKCIILCPTRELASQTLEVLERICQSCFAGWLVPGGLLGGDSRQSEKARVRKGLAVIVATPGRLLDHLHKTQSLLMSLKGKLEWFVLDEADRLLDMGLGDQVRQIVQLIRANEACKSRTTTWWRSVLVSATVTSSVQALAKERMLCGNQSWVWIKSSDERKKQTTKLDEEEDTSLKNQKLLRDETSASDGYSESTPRQLEQFHLIVTAKLRLSSLVAFLIERISKRERTVVFLGTCASVDFHYKLFCTMNHFLSNGNSKEGKDDKGLFGHNILFKLHGSVKHSQRTQTLKKFAAAPNAAVLLTTDVSARGLNLQGVDWTVQYDPPCEISDYVHRVGRVARAGNAGHSLLFLLPSEKGYLDVLQTKGISNLTALSLAHTLNQAANRCPVWTAAGKVYSGGKSNADAQLTNYTKNNSRQGEYFAAEVQRRLEDVVIQDDITTKAEASKQTSKKKRRTAKPEGELLGMARDAFLSFLRAYPTKKEPSVRSIFSARALHLGHIARSFALKEPPKALASKHRIDSKDKEKEILDTAENKPKSLDFSRLDDNLIRHDFSKDDDDETDTRPSKRLKMKQGKAQNSKILLLENARKMQSNLMDAM